MKLYKKAENLIFNFIKTGHMHLISCMNRIITFLFIIPDIPLFFWGCDGIVNPNYTVTPFWFTGSGDLPDGIEFTLEAPHYITILD